MPRYRAVTTLQPRLRYSLTNYVSKSNVSVYLHRLPGSLFLGVVPVRLRRHSFLSRDKFEQLFPPNRVLLPRISKNERCAYPPSAEQIRAGNTVT